MLELFFRTLGVLATLDTRTKKFGGLVAHSQELLETLSVLGTPLNTRLFHFFTGGLRNKRRCDVVSAQE